MSPPPWPPPPHRAPPPILSPRPLSSSAAGGRPGRDLRRVAGRDRPITPECGGQLAERLLRGPGAHPLVALDLDRFSPSLRDRDRDHLVGHRAAIPCALGSLVRARRPRVLLLAADLELAVHVIRALAHVLLQERRPQTVMDH